MISFKGGQFEREIILWGVRWYVAYPISYRQLEEMMQERGVDVDHSTLNRWVIKYAPEFEKQFRRRHHPVGRSWRLDEMDVSIQGKWAYLYRAVDKEGHTSDVLLTPTRDRDAAEAFVPKAIRTQGLPEKITIDQRGSNTAALTPYNRTHKTTLSIRQCKDLNKIVEQDHRAVKRKVRPMLGFKSFWSARCTIAGLEVMPAMRPGQLATLETAAQTPAEQFYALAVEITKSDNFARPPLKFATKPLGVRLLWWKLGTEDAIAPWERNAGDDPQHVRAVAHLRLRPVTEIGPRRTEVGFDGPHQRRGREVL